MFLCVVGSFPFDLVINKLIFIKFLINLFFFLAFSFFLSNDCYKYLIYNANHDEKLTKTIFKFYLHLFYLYNIFNIIYCTLLNLF